MPSSNLCFNKPVCQSLLSVYFPLQATGESGEGGAGVVAGPKHFGTAAKAEIIKFAHRAESHTKLPMSKTHFAKYFPLLSPLIFNPSLPPSLVQELNVPRGEATLVQLWALIHSPKISNYFNAFAKGTATYCICCLTVLLRGKRWRGGNANLGRLNIPMQRRRASSCSCVVAMWLVGGIKLVYDQLTECSAECKNCA